MSMPASETAAADLPASGSTAPALEVRGLSKKYCRSFRRGVYYMGLDMLGSVVRRSRGGPLREGEFWALDNVDLEVRPGECLGVIGHNGAGKSTLLKILSGVIEPTCGEAVIRGRVGSLIEIGAGFHPDLSGRENIYINAAILGMPRKEIENRFDEIVAFADIGEFLDTPVRFYSSGMYIRLGFAVAAHTEPDVLLVDEVLAVGDRAFRAKCLKHFDRLMKRGCAVVLVSHNLSMIHNQCHRALLLEKGTILADGPPGEVLDRYRLEALKHEAEAEADASTPDNEVRHPDLKIAQVAYLDEKQKSVTQFKTGDQCNIQVELEAGRALEAPVFNLAILAPGGKQMTAWRSDHSEAVFEDLKPGRNVFTLTVDALNLLPGNYYLSVRIWKERVLGEMYCSREEQWPFQILGGFDVLGYCYLPHRWGALRHSE